MWILLAIFAIQLLQTDFDGDFTIITKDKETGKVEIGKIEVNKPGVNPIIDFSRTGANDTVHAIFSGYSLDGTITLDYSRRLFNLHLFKIDASIGIAQPPGRGTTWRTGFVIRF